MKKREKGLFIPQWVIDVYGISLESAIIALLLSYRSTKNGSLFMKQAEIAQNLCATERGIRKAIDRLCEKKVIEKEKCNFTRGNEYRLNEQHPIISTHITAINSPKQDSTSYQPDEPF